MPLGDFIPCISAVRTLFVEHPHSIGMTYRQHQKRAWGMARQTGAATAALIIHGLFPFWHTDTGSRLVHKCYEQYVKK